MKILVIIVTYNGERWIKAGVDSVRQSSIPADLVVIDNGSTDGTLGILDDLGVAPVRMGSNVGFGQANNVGLRKALQEGYDFAYLLNQDARLTPDCLEKLAKAQTGHPEFGILSPVQLDGGGQKMDLQFGRRCGPYLNRVHVGAVLRVPFVMASHWMISRACLLAVGGFSPAFTLYGEDDNYIDRARHCGFLTAVVPDAFGIHDRAQRPNPKERRMYLKCTTALAHALNPNVPGLLALTGAPLELLAMGLRHRSLIPIRYIVKLIGRYPELRRLRKSDNCTL